MKVILKISCHCPLESRDRDEKLNADSFAVTVCLWIFLVQSGSLFSFWTPLGCLFILSVLECGLHLSPCAPQHPFWLILTGVSLFTELSLYCFMFLEIPWPCLPWDWSGHSILDPITLSRAIIPPHANNVLCLFLPYLGPFLVPRTFPRPISYFAVFSWQTETLVKLNYQQTLLFNQAPEHSYRKNTTCAESSPIKLPIADLQWALTQHSCDTSLVYLLYGCPDNYSRFPSLGRLPYPLWCLFISLWLHHLLLRELNQAAGTLSTNLPESVPMLIPLAFFPASTDKWSKFLPQCCKCMFLISFPTNLLYGHYLSKLFFLFLPLFPFLIALYKLLLLISPVIFYYCGIQLPFLCLHLTWYLSCIWHSDHFVLETFFFLLETLLMLIFLLPFWLLLLCRTLIVLECPRIQFFTFGSTSLLNTLSF